MQNIQDLKSKKTWFVILIYAVMLVYFIYKMIFYSNYVGGFPDEIVHISYVAYLQDENKIIPDFAKMTILASKDGSSFSATDSFKTNEPFVFTQGVNYLGHPPLYYQIMRLSGGIKIKNGDVTFNIDRLRAFSQFIAVLAMLIVFYIGFSRIGKNPAFHLLYASIVTSVPMLAFTCAGINNDTMAFLGVSIFMLGILRFSERKRNLLTYFLIGIAVFISFLSKETAGVIIAIALLAILIYTGLKEKSLRFLVSRNFLATLPLYFAVAAYYLIVKSQTGTLLPTIRTLSPAQFYASGFYVQPAKRVFMNFGQYASYYFYNFMKTWYSIQSHIILNKTGMLYSRNKIALLALWAAPLFSLIPLMIRNKKKKVNNSAFFAAFAVYLGVILTAFYQFLRAYDEFKNVSGYLGGYQSRYYLCGISAIALAIVYFTKSIYYMEPSGGGTGSFFARPKHVTLKTVLRLTKRIFINLGCLFFSGLIIYEDFIYFVLHYKHYL